MKTAILVGFVSFGLLLLRLLVLAIRSRFGERKPDPPGQRSVCTFSGGQAGATTDTGAPPAAEILPPLDAALRSLAGIHDIAWHRRERFLAGDLGTAAPHPLS